MSDSAAIVIGAGSSIGSALCERWQQDDAVSHVFAVSRQLAADHEQSEDATIHHIHSDYTEASIKETCETIKTLMDENHTDTISRVCICNGILHNENVWPEKRIEELTSDSLIEVFTINSVTPLLWLKALITLVKAPSDCIITVFNARIGSIGDNRSGGWYSYRASKAALNMLLKTAAIEYSRRAKNVKLISFHPGTTDTALSKPFQRTVRKENLFTPNFVADHLVRIMNMQNVDGELSFVDWENKSIDW